MLILERLLLYIQMFFLPFIRGIGQTLGSSRSSFYSRFAVRHFGSTQLIATAQNLRSNDRTKGHMHITESSDNFMRDVKNYIAPRCAEISPFYCINIYKIWLNRHCSTSVNTGKAISGDVSANKKISKIHGEYRFKDVCASRFCFLRKFCAAQGANARACTGYLSFHTVASEKR